MTLDIVMPSEDAGVAEASPVGSFKRGPVLAGDMLAIVVEAAVFGVEAHIRGHRLVVELDRGGEPVSVDHDAGEAVPEPGTDPEDKTVPQASGQRPVALGGGESDNENEKVQSALGHG
jgi:hypothetical protein